MGFASRTGGLTAAVFALSMSLALPAQATSVEESTDSYIVITTGDSATNAAVDEAVESGADVSLEYGAAVEGFAAELTPSQVDALENQPGVVEVVPDGIITTQACATVVPAGTEGCAEWNLDRLDTRSNLSDSLFTPVGNGADVVIYIVDTGVYNGTANDTHTEFTGRIGAYQKDIFGNDSVPNDCNGHGTHVAGTAAGTTYGVAKQATIVGVKVMGLVGNACSSSGYLSYVIAGLDWITANHAANYPGKRAVVNISLGSSAYAPLDTAVDNVIAAGIPVVVAAGNSGGDASNESPARVANAITVGNTTSSDARLSSSNYGASLDLFAPGTNILSAYYTSNTATEYLSGTSMASPHVAGAAAVYLGMNSNATPAEVATALTTNATSGVVTSPGTGSPNKLLYLRSFSTRGSQVVTWSPSNTSASMPASSVTPNATPTSTGDGTFTYSILPSSTASCSVDASGTVSYTAAGSCYVMSTAAQTATYDSAFKVATFIVNRLSQTVTWAPTNTSLTTSESPATPDASASTTGDGSITYAVTSAGTTGCTVDSNTAVLTFTAAGTCTVAGTAAQTATYNADSESVSFTITGSSGGGSSSGGSSGGSGSSGGGSSSGGSSSGSASSSSSSASSGGSLQAITELRPALGPLAGGNTIAIIGFGFTGATSVTIGGKPAPFRVVNDAHVEATVPAGDRLGSADVAVVLTPARGRAFAPGGYVYTAELAVAPAQTAAPAVPAGSVTTPQVRPTIVTSLVASRPTTAVSPTRAVTVRTNVPVALAGERMNLTRKGKVIASATVSPTGNVTFKSKRIVSGKYRLSTILDGRTLSSSIMIKVP